MIALQTLDDREVALVGDLVALVRAARQQEALQVLAVDHLAHLAIEHRGIGRGDHRLEDLRLAVVAIERAAAGRHRERRECVLAAAFQIAARVRLERRRREADLATAHRFARALEVGDQAGVEFGVLELLDGRNGFEPAHRRNLLQHGLPLRQARHRPPSFPELPYRQCRASKSRHRSSSTRASTSSRNALTSVRTAAVARASASVVSHCGRMSSSSIRSQCSRSQDFAALGWQAHRGSCDRRGAPTIRSSSASASTDCSRPRPAPPHVARAGRSAR